MSRPVANYNFEVRLLDAATKIVAGVGRLFGADVHVDAGFRQCRGLEGTLEVEPYQEGGRNDTVLQFPTRMAWSNITLERGAGMSEDMWDWYRSYLTGRGKRRDGLIVLVNDRRDPVVYWKFRRGLPVRWTGPTLDALGRDVAIESIEIAHEGLTVQPGPGLFG